MALTAVAGTPATAVSHFTGAAAATGNAVSFVKSATINRVAVAMSLRMRGLPTEKGRNARVESGAQYRAPGLIKKHENPLRLRAMP